VLRKNNQTGDGFGAGPLEAMSQLAENATTTLASIAPLYNEDVSF
jgi:hypothetical protein